MGQRVELRQEDLLRADRPAAPEPGADEAEDDGNVSDLLGTVRQFNLEVQQTMTQFRELLSLAAQVRGGTFPGMRSFGGFGGFGAAAPAPPPPPPAASGGGPAGPDPKAQLLAGLEQIKAEVGDVTLLELVNVLAKQYGGLRLSDIISRIK